MSYLQFRIDQAAAQDAVMKTIRPGLLEQLQHVQIVISDGLSTSAWILRYRASGVKYAQMRLK